MKCVSGNVWVKEQKYQDLVLGIYRDIKCVPTFSYPSLRSKAC